MQKTEHHGWLFHLFATGEVFCLSVTLLMLIAAPLRAGEPTMTLAANQPVNKNSTVALVYSVSATISSSSNLKNSPPEAPSQNSVKAPALTSGSRVENQTNSIHPESFLLIREDSHSNKPVTVQAGYGQIWDDKSTLQKISSDHQEPGCAYVSANFSF